MNFTISTFEGLCTTKGEDFATGLANVLQTVVAGAKEATLVAMVYSCQLMRTCLYFGYVQDMQTGNSSHVYDCRQSAVRKTKKRYNLRSSTPQSQARMPCVQGPW